MTTIVKENGEFFERFEIVNNSIGRFVAKHILTIAGNDSEYGTKEFKTLAGAERFAKRFFKMI